MTKTEKVKKTSWDYNESVAMIAPKILKWKTLTLDIYQELYKARKQLSRPGARNDLTSKQKLRGWTQYCKDIGIDKSTANRWLEHYDEKNDCVLLKTPEEIEDDEWQASCQKKEKLRQTKEAECKRLFALFDIRRTGTIPEGWTDKLEKEWAEVKEKSYAYWYFSSHRNVDGHYVDEMMEFRESVDGIEDVITAMFEKHNIEWLSGHEARYQKCKKERDEKYERIFGFASSHGFGFSGDAERFTLGNPAENTDQADLFAGLEKYLSGFENDSRRMDALAKIMQWAKMKRAELDGKEAARSA